jgi:hypothetical protein
MLTDDELRGLQRMKHHGLRGAGTGCIVAAGPVGDVLSSMGCGVDFGAVAKSTMNAARSALTPR